MTKTTRQVMERLIPEAGLTRKQIGLVEKALESYGTQQSAEAVTQFATKATTRIQGEIDELDQASQPSEFQKGARFGCRFGQETVKTLTAQALSKTRKP